MELDPARDQPFDRPFSKIVLWRLIRNHLTFPKSECFAHQKESTMTLIRRCTSYFSERIRPSVDVSESSARRLLLTLVLSLVPLGSASADRELVTFAVEQYGSSPRCCEGCGQLPGLVEMTLAFSEAFSDYDTVERWFNQAVDGRDFTDPDLNPNGADNQSPRGTDWADVIFYTGHGGRQCGDRPRWVPTMGDSEMCRPRTDLDMRFGGSSADRDANAMVTFSCQSAHRCVWESGGYDNLDAGSFNIWNGFHGTTWLGAGTAQAIRNYGRDARHNDIGDAWLDDMFRSSSSHEPSCPVSIVWGSNEAQAEEFFDDAGWKDFHDVGAHNVSMFFFIQGCDPRNGEKL